MSLEACRMGVEQRCSWIQSRNISASTSDDALYSRCGGHSSTHFDILFHSFISFFLPSLALAIKVCKNKVYVRFQEHHNSGERMSSWCALVRRDEEGGDCRLNLAIKRLRFSFFSISNFFGRCIVTTYPNNTLLLILLLSLCLVFFPYSYYAAE